MVNLHTLVALVFVITLMGCTSKTVLVPQPPTGEPVKTPAEAAATSASTSPAGEAPHKPTNAAELVELLDQATRIEAKSGKYEKPTWSKDLTREEIANLKAGIGEATDFSNALPRCIPTVVVTLYERDNERASLGAFCDRERSALTGAMTFDIKGKTGSFTPQDIAKVDAALKSPVEE